MSFSSSFSSSNCTVKMAPGGVHVPIMRWCSPILAVLALVPAELVGCGRRGRRVSPERGRARLESFTLDKCTSSRQQGLQIQVLCAVMVYEKVLRLIKRERAQLETIIQRDAASSKVAAPAPRRLKSHQRCPSFCRSTARGSSSYPWRVGCGGGGINALAAELLSSGCRSRGDGDDFTARDLAAALALLISGMDVSLSRRCPV